MLLPVLDITGFEASRSARIRGDGPSNAVYLSQMPSSPFPSDWFADLEFEEQEPRSGLIPPGPAIPLRLRTLSHCQETVFLANRLNACSTITAQMRYDFLFHAGALEKRRTTGWGRRRRENEADLELVMTAYNLGKAKARQALKILTADQLATLRDQMRRGGL